MLTPFARAILAGALAGIVMFGFLSRLVVSSLRTQLTSARDNARRWRNAAERLELEAAEDKARLAMFEMGGGK